MLESKIVNSLNKTGIMPNVTLTGFNTNYSVNPNCDCDTHDTACNCDCQGDLASDCVCDCHDS